MPVLNEERHLAEAVHAILDQDWPGELEVVLALGPSNDATDAVAGQIVATDPRVLTVPNPTGRTAAGLNAAIARSSGDVIVRVDGHAMIPREYVRIAVETLERTGADNVGGIMAAQGVTPFEQAVARAMRSPLGVGGAAFHVGGEPGPALTVYLGCFRRSAIERVGGYDESFVRAQDWEMNHRIRASGGQVWFTPELRVTYRPRGSVKALAKQYFEYGRWRRQIVRRHEGTVSPRYLAPPAAVAGIAAGTVLGLAGTLTGSRPLRAGWLAPAGYAVLATAGGLAIGRGLAADVRLRVPVALATMHLAWGTGFLTSPTDLA